MLARYILEVVHCTFTHSQVYSLAVVINSNVGDRVLELWLDPTASSDGFKL